MNAGQQPPIANGTRVGWVGLGVMGASMCRHLLEAGIAVTAHSRSRERVASEILECVEWANTPGAVAARSNVIFTMVGHPADVRSVLLGDSGVLSRCRAGTIIVDMTTSAPSLAVEIHDLASGMGVHVLDAPVSGGDVGARNATLSIMVGGSAETLDETRPLLQLMGKTVIHQGGPGAGQHTKMANQTLIASGLIGVCEGLLYAYKAGLDLRAVLASVVSGAAGSWSLENYSPRMLAGEFTPGFKVEHFIKDLSIALEECRRMDLALPGLALAQQLYIALNAQRGGNDGVHALVLALARLSSVDWPTVPAAASSTSG